MPTIKRKLFEIRSSIRKDIGKYGSEWTETQPVFLGDYTQAVLTPTAGIFYARQYNGKVIQVFNAVNMPATFDLHVIVGRKKTQPSRWQIIEERDVYLTPAATNSVGHHAAQHMLNGGDRVPIDRKQIIQFVVQVTDPDGFIVALNGGVARTGTGIVKVPTQFLDLSSYVITSGAKYVAIELADDGTLFLNEGNVFAALDAATDADIPIPDEGKHTLAFVALYESQDTLSDNDIVVLMPIALSPPPEASDTHWEPVTVTVEKEFHLWKVDGALAAVTDAAESVLVIRDVKLSLAYIHCKNNGSAGSTIVDINLNGTTIFTTSANQPELDNTDAYNVSGTPDIVDLIAGDVLTMDIDQIATGAADLTIKLTEVTHELVFAGNDLIMVEVPND